MAIGVGGSARELCAGAHAGLAVDPGQMGLDGLDGREELRRDFAIRASSGDERGHVLLRRRQVAVASRPRVGAPKLVVGALLPGGGAELAEDSSALREAPLQRGDAHRSGRGRRRASVGVCELIRRPDRREPDACALEQHDRSRRLARAEDGDPTAAGRRCASPWMVEGRGALVQPIGKSFGLVELADRGGGLGELERDRQQAGLSDSGCVEDRLRARKVLVRDLRRLQQERERPARPGGADNEPGVAVRLAVRVRFRSVALGASPLRRGERRGVPAGIRDWPASGRSPGKDRRRAHERLLPNGRSGARAPRRSGASTSGTASSPARWARSRLASKQRSGALEVSVAQAGSTERERGIGLGRSRIGLKLERAFQLSARARTSHGNRRSCRARSARRRAAASPSPSRRSRPLVQPLARPRSSFQPQTPSVHASRVCARARTVASSACAQASRRRSTQTVFSRSSSDRSIRTRARSSPDDPTREQVVEFEAPPRREQRRRAGRDGWRRSGTSRRRALAAHGRCRREP